MATHNKQIGRSLRKICPKVLFSTVAGERYYNYGKDKDLYPSNIAAFKINGSTYDNIEVLFFSLSHLWFEDWSKEVLILTENFYLGITPHNALNYGI